jgi:recombination protein U
MTCLSQKINTNLIVRMNSYIIIPMSTIKYPTAVKSRKVSNIQDFHSGRGMNLENEINESNKFYRAGDYALIYKKPTPVQVVRVDYPERRRAKIVEAYYRTPSTTDYNGVYRGKYIDFEAKETKNKTSFPIYLIHPHQIEHLKKVKFHGGIGFFIIRFTSHNETYLVDAPLLIEKIETIERESIPYDWFRENGHIIKEGYQPRLQYLKVVDKLYFS